MPVTNSFLPLRQQELNLKIRANEPDQMAQLLKDVKDHIEGGPAVYQQSPYGTRDVKLPAEKCVVFLIRGKYMVDGRNDYEEGKAHVVENEETIQLQQGAAVVIITLE